MLELLVAESTPLEADTCNGETQLYDCAHKRMQKPFHKQHHLSGTRSLSMPLDTGFRRQQSTCLAVFSAGTIVFQLFFFQLNSFHSALVVSPCSERRP